MSEPSARRRGKQRTYRIAAAVAACVAALFVIGSVEPRFLVPAVVLALVGRLAVIDLPRLSSSARLASTALWGLAGWTAFQSLPVPPAVLRRLSPRAAETWAAADALTGSTAWHPLTVDPPATQFALATAITVALVFESWAKLTRASATRELLAQALAGVIAAFCLVGLLHAAAGLSALYGIYVPQHATPTPYFFAPLLNPNHAAAVASAGVPIFLCLLYAAKTPVASLYAGAGAIVCIVAATLSLSRGGILVTVAELGGVALVLRRLPAPSRSRARRQNAWKSILALGLAAAVGVGLAGYVGVERLTHEAANKDVSKVAIALRTYEVAAHIPFGVGRGAFGSFFTAEQAGLGDKLRFTHAEHWPAQLAIDIGPVAACAFVVLLALAVRRSVRPSSQDPILLGLAIALAGMVVHDLADFALDFAGAGTIGAAILGVVTGREERSNDGESTSSSRSARSERSASRRALSAVAVGAAGLLGLVVVLRARSRMAEDDINTLRASWASGKVDESAALEAIGRHPAEAYFPMALAVARLGTDDAAHAFVAALHLAPRRAQTHYWFGTWLLRRGVDAQAISELRTAVEIDGRLEAIVVSALVRAHADAWDLAGVCVTPAGYDRAVAALHASNKDDEAEELDALYIERLPPAISGRLRNVRRLRAKGDNEGAVREAMAITAAAPTSADAWLARAALAQDPVDAEDILSEGVTATQEALPVVREYARIKGVRLGLSSVTNELELYRARLLASGHGVDEYYALMGEIELIRNHKGVALKHYRDANTSARNPAQYLDRIAEICEQLGLTRGAVDALSKLVSLRPSDAHARAELERLTAKAASATAPPVVLKLPPAASATQ